MGSRSTAASEPRAAAATRAQRGRPGWSGTGADRHGGLRRELHRPGAALPPTRPRVRVPELVVGILLVAGCALGVLVWHISATTTREALVLARPVGRGQLLTAADFAPAPVAGSGVVLVPYADRTRFEGRFAATDLAAGTPLADSLALAATPLPAGEALIGRRLAPGLFPSGLAAGDAVVVVLVGEQPVVIAGTGRAPAAASDSAAPTANVGVPALGGPAGEEALAVPPGGFGTGAVPGAAPEAKPAFVEAATVESVSPAATSEAVDVTLRAAADVAARIAAADDVRLVQVGG